MDNLSQIKRGDRIQISQKITEGKRERIVPWSGRVMRIKGAGQNMMITVAQTLDGVAVEKIFPVMIPSIVKIELVEEKNAKKQVVRRKTNLSQKFKAKNQ